MSLISRLITGKPDGRDALRPLWHRIVEIARDPNWYARCGLADTLPGRFDAVCLVTALVMIRMERGGPDGRGLVEESARLTELFIDDMDGQMRQAGVGDLVVGKRMGKLMGALAGRISALREAFETDEATLVAAVERNATLIEGASGEALAGAVRALHARLEALPDADLLAGRIAQ